MINQKQILSKIEKVSNFSVIQEHPEILSDLQKLKKRIKDDTFHIAVVGEFSSGKSTFINAILGKDMLSHAVNETTATITRICHVNETDERLGFCDILYYDGKTIRIKDTSQLKNYTTVQEGDDVAEKIRSVTVYVHLPYISHAITIVDTPGLNGIADKHREITFEEVKKAHACVYLLSSKGLKESDGEILHNLMNYQSEFIFVQNFIDDLRTTEGETYDAKLEDDCRNLEKICGTAIMQNCHICGVSALKALCARDINIQRLYSTDTAPLTHEDRERLAIESNFQSFENIITGIVNTGEYKQIIYRSAGQVLSGIIQQVLNELENQQAINAELQKNDSQQNRIALAEKKLEQLQSRKERQEKQLGNFIIFYAKDCRKSLTEYIKNQIQEIENDIHQEIEQKIRNFNQYQEFEKTVKMDVSVHFSKRASDAVNQRIIPDIQKYIRNDMEDIYSASMQRVSKYTSVLIGANDYEKLDIQLEEADKEILFRNRRRLEELSKMESQVGEMKAELSGYESSVQKAQRELQSEEKNLQYEKRQLKNQQQDYRGKVSSLGARPGVQQIKKTKTEQRKKTGFFKKLWGFITGDKYETVEIVYYETDNSAQRAWDADKRKLDEKYQAQLASNSRKIDACSAAIAKLQSRISQDRTQAGQLNEKILHFQKIIEKEHEIYEITEKQFREEYCSVLKKRMLESLHDSLFETENCAYLYLKKYIHDMYEKNLPSLQECVINVYRQNVSAQEKQLQEAISQTEEELQKKYHAIDEEMNLLKKIQEDVI